MLIIFNGQKGVLIKIDNDGNGIIDEIQTMGAETRYNTSIVHPVGVFDDPPPIFFIPAPPLPSTSTPTSTSQ